MNTSILVVGTNVPTTSKVTKTKYFINLLWIVLVRYAILPLVPTPSLAVVLRNWVT